MRIQGIFSFDYFCSQKKAVFCRRFTENEMLTKLRVMLKKENNYTCKTDYMITMQQESGIKPAYRAKLATWLFAFETEFNVQKSTILVALNLFDRYLSMTTVYMDELQLIALSCMFIAAKLKENKPFKTKHLAALAESSYSIQDILTFERNILTELRFKVLPLCSLDFYDFFILALRLNFCSSSSDSTVGLNWSKIEPNWVNVTSLGRLFLCCTFYSYFFIQFKPSELALCSIQVLLNYLNINSAFWSESLFREFNIDLAAEKYRVCMDNILKLFELNNPHFSNLEYQFCQKIENIGISSTIKQNYENEEDKENIPPKYID